MTQMAVRALCCVLAALLVAAVWPRLASRATVIDAERETANLRHQLHVAEIHDDQAARLERAIEQVPDDFRPYAAKVRLALIARNLIDDPVYEDHARADFIRLLSVHPGNPDFWAMYARHVDDAGFREDLLALSLHLGRYDTSSALKRLALASRHWDELSLEFQIAMTDQIAFLWGFREERSVASAYLRSGQAFRDAVIASIPQTFGQQKKLARLTGTWTQPDE